MGKGERLPTKSWDIMDHGDWFSCLSPRVARGGGGLWLFRILGFGFCGYFEPAGREGVGGNVYMSCWRGLGYNSKWHARSMYAWSTLFFYKKKNIGLESRCVECNCPRRQMSSHGKAGALLCKWGGVWIASMILYLFDKASVRRWVDLYRNSVRVLFSLTIPFSYDRYFIAFPTS